MSGRFFADEIIIRGAHVRIVRDTEGRLNIDDLLGREGEPVAFDIGRVAIEDSALTFSDLSTGARYELSHVALESGRLANGVPTSFVLALDATDAQSTWKLAAALKTRLVFDLTQQRFAVERAALELKGHVSGMTDLAAQVNGDVIFQGSVSELRATDVVAVIKGRVGEELIEARLEAPRILAVPAHASAENLVVSLRAQGSVGTTRANLVLPQVKRDADAFSSPAVTLELELKRGETTVQAGVASALEGRIAAPQLALKDLKASFNANGPRLPGKHLSGALRGDAALDLEKQGVRVKLGGKVADSHVKADLTAAGFAAPVYTFVVDVDQIDLDRYAANGPAARRRTEPAAGSGIEPGPTAVGAFGRAARERHRSYRCPEGGKRKSTQCETGAQMKRKARDSAAHAAKMRSAGASAAASRFRATRRRLAARTWTARPAVARKTRSVCDLDLGNHVAANPGRHGHSLL